MELSSYQTGEVARSGARPQVAVVLNLFPEHLDWHGSEQRYIEDKLRLVTEAAPRIAVLNAADPHLAALSPPERGGLFNQPQAGTCGATSCITVSRPFDTRNTPLPAVTIAGNLCGAAALEALGLDAVALAPAVQDSARCRTACSASRGRWPDLRQRSISTTPHASLAALECCRAAHRAAGGRARPWPD